jgi:pyridinium-3,5-biscarboxylic acid mononucleotide sulfurtransferase
MNTEYKYEQLKINLKSMKNLIVAFSGGVDSTFLLKVAHDVQGNKLLAVTAKSSMYPEREFREALDFILNEEIEHRVLESEELDIEGFSDNPLNRCYLCKKELFNKIKRIAALDGYEFIAEGSNYDDLNDYRPGQKAIEELDIVSPLRDVKLTKREIRILSKEMGLKTWDKPSFACLASRFPYGVKITKEKLKIIDEAEEFLINLGFKQVRVRYHEDIARIELNDDDFNRILDGELRLKIHSKLKDLGFLYVSLDLKGYRTGSMNESFHMNIF